MKAAKPLVLIAVLGIVAVAAFLLVSQATDDDILVSGVAAAPIDGKPNSVGIFLTITNSGKADRLVSARSIVAQRSRLQHSVADSGLPIPAGGEATLSPDGAFILMDGMHGDQKEGRMIPVTLRFENAGELRTQARLVTPQQSGNAAKYGLFGLGDICTVEEGEPAPAISLEVEADGEEWIVRVLTDDFSFTPELADGAHVPGTGHGHLYLGGLKLQRLYEPVARIGALPPGRHEVRVTLNTNDHRAYVVDDQPVSAIAEIIVR